MRITSATRSCSGFRSCRPLRNVPLVDPMSSMYMNWPRGKIRQCAAEANGSSIFTSALFARPIVIPPFRSNSSPGSWPIAATTSSRGNTPERRSIRCSGGAPADGPVSSIASAPPRPATSRKAERETHSRKRNSTARKPNLSRTAIGSFTPARPPRLDPRREPLLHLERQPLEPERDLVAGRQRALGDAVAVDLHAVGRAEVGHDPGAALAAQLRVATRHVGVLERHVAVAAAADHHTIPAE